MYFDKLSDFSCISTSKMLIFVVVVIWTQLSASLLVKARCLDSFISVLLAVNGKVSFFPVLKLVIPVSCTLYSSCSTLPFLQAKGCGICDLWDLGSFMYDVPPGHCHTFLRQPGLCEESGLPIRAQEAPTQSPEACILEHLEAFSFMDASSWFLLLITD